MKRILMISVLALALVAVACGDDGGTATTVPTTAPGGGPSGADAAAAKSDAVVTAAPDGWTVEVTNLLSGGQTNIQQQLFTPCIEEGSLDLATIDAMPSTRARYGGSLGGSRSMASRPESRPP